MFALYYLKKFNKDSFLFVQASKVHLTVFSPVVSFFQCKSSKFALLIFVMIKAPKDQEGPYGIPAVLVGVYPPPRRIWCIECLRGVVTCQAEGSGNTPPSGTPGAKVVLVAYQDRSPKRD